MSNLAREKAPAATLAIPNRCLEMPVGIGIAGWSIPTQDAALFVKEGPRPPV